MKPEELLYTKEHEWIGVEDQGGEKIVTVGISDFAVKELTDLVYLELPDVGKQFDAAEEFGVVESVKAVSPLYAPIGLEITEINSKLPDDLDRLSEDAYGAGWMIKAKVLNPAELDGLLTFEAYSKLCEEE
ncbi:MAG: glycine cleavage system protein GcvH [Planctomycetales bacterium]